ncbi:hypothetical protein [Algirhabdus cladophorae]|uniref:hypothetical protein n=1 Tax=Algirhabdus cladophorae TaxID=3377108 RepID=UPI003B848D6C
MMILSKLPLSAAALVLCTSLAAQADVTVRFIESAPKDSFVVTNTSACALPAQVLTLDLSTSAAGLIFDVTDQGAGVEVFQPLEFVQGQPLVQTVSQPMDGDQQLVMSLNAMQPGEVLRLTIDLDDTLAAGELGQIRVSGSEIEGAQVLQSLGSFEPTIASFNSKGMATVATPACTS